MTTTDRFYGPQTAGVGRTVQDIGLCDLKGQYVYTAKARMKGLLVVVFFAPDSPPSVRALQAVQGWTQDVPAAMWTALGISEGDRGQLNTFAQEQGITDIPILVDNELYQTRTWGVSHLPSTYLISGQGRVLMKVIGDRAEDLTAARQRLSEEVAKLVAAEEAAKKAEEEKKAADAAKK